MDIYQVSFVWKKDDRTIPKSVRLSTTDLKKGCLGLGGEYHHDTDPSILVSCSIRIFSKGKFTCIATNVHGSTSKSMQLIVLRKCEICKRAILKNY